MLYLCEMYEEGDKIVCIENQHKYDGMRVGEIYTINKIDRGDIKRNDIIIGRYCWISIEELNNRYFSDSLFTPLHIYQRKDKINKLKEKYDINR